MGTTRFTINVENENSQPVSGARVKLIVDNQQVSKIGDKTDSKGTFTWSWPSKKARYTGTCYASKGILSDKEEFFVVKDDHKIFLLVLEKPNSAEARWQDRSFYPVQQRTEREILQDLAWGFGITSQAFEDLNAKGVKLGLGTSAALGNIAFKAGKAHAYLQKTKTFAEFQKSWKHGWGKYAGIEIIGGLYTFFDAVAAEDAKGAASALATNILKGVLGALSPTASLFFIGVNVTYGLRALMEAFKSGLPQVTEAVVRQKYLPELNHIASCEAHKGYRIDLSTTPYSVKHSWKPGLAFDKKGRLVLAVGSKTATPIPTPNKAVAKRVKGTINYAQAEGLL